VKLLVLPPNEHVPRWAWGARLRAGLGLLFAVVITSNATAQTPTVGAAASRPELVVQLGHSSSVLSVAFSPDGQFVLTGSWDHTAQLWETDTGRGVRRFRGHTQKVNSAVFSPDGRHVLTGSDDSTVRLWDAEGGTEIRRLEGHTGWIGAVAISPDGQLAVTGSGDNTARLWDLENAIPLRLFEGYIRPVLAVAISPDGRHVLTGSGDNSARLWDANTGAELCVDSLAGRVASQPLRSPLTGGTS
jgi:WD40 repeat protein